MFEFSNDLSGGIEFMKYMNCIDGVCIFAILVLISCIQKHNFKDIGT